MYHLLGYAVAAIAGALVGYRLKDCEMRETDQSKKKEQEEPKKSTSKKSSD